MCATAYDLEFSVLKFHRSQLRKARRCFVRTNGRAHTCIMRSLHVMVKLQVMPDSYQYRIQSMVRITNVSTQNVSLVGRAGRANTEAVYNLCLTLNIALYKLCR